MKKAFLWAILAVLLVLTSGCMRVGITGGPQIHLGGGLRAGLFPPQLLLGVTNTTPLILRVKVLSAVDRLERTLVQGQEIDVPLRGWGGCRDAMVTVSAYEPETGRYITSTTRRYNVCSGENRTDSWEVRWSGDRNSYAIQ